MSKFFFNGRIESREDYGRYGDSTKPKMKLGSKKQPLTLVVTDEARQSEIESILSEHSLFANINLDEEGQENIVELEGVLNKPKTQVFEKKPDRNDPCSCGSGKKYKKCCG
jgi:SWIM/SEC-C metal-binding protein